MARAKENASAQGSRDLNRRFMVFKRAEASSADWPPDKKAIPGTAAGTVRHRLFIVMLATSSTLSLSLFHFLRGAGEARQHHVGFENHAFQHHALGIQLVENGSQDFLRHRAAPLQSMIAVHQHFRLDDGNQSSLLAQRGIARQRVCVGLDTTTAGNSLADGNHRPPLGKPRAHLKVFLQTAAQSVQAFGDFFAGMSGQVLGSGIHFDAGNNSRIV